MHILKRLPMDSKIVLHPNKLIFNLLSMSFLKYFHTARVTDQGRKWFHSIFNSSDFLLCKCDAIANKKLLFPNKLLFTKKPLLAWSSIYKCKSCWKCQIKSSNAIFFSQNNAICVSPNKPHQHILIINSKYHGTHYYVNSHLITSCLFCVNSAHRFVQIIALNSAPVW